MTINRGEVWLVNLNPTVGSEIRKTRPAIVVSSNSVGTLPIRLVAPITEWKAAFAGRSWLVQIDPDGTNGLAKPSAADTLQLRGIDTGRFVKQLGVISAEIMVSITAAIAAVVEYEP